ncbi:MAG: DUF1566 domain-containing protein [Betaproteobacteria bacterium]|nr:DUF1566 domain-containing protein [Betaproteobacteria bacterium]
MRALLLIVLTLVSLPAFSSYTKIANNGSDLPASAVLGSGATQWACTRDNATGLVWEVKTTDGGLRDWNKGYTNYDDTNQAQKLTGSVAVKPTQAEINAASNSIGFVNAVNAAALCGSAAWRMPSKDELLGLVNTSYTPAIDPIYFPNTPSSSWFWSGSLAAGYPYRALDVYFGNGDVYVSDRSDGDRVRLVRAGQSFALSVSAAGSGSGAIADSTGGINCGSTCSASFSSGAVVTLTATPASGSTFSGWGGACSGTGTCQVTMSAARSVTATFALNAALLPDLIVTAMTAPSSAQSGGSVSVTATVTNQGSASAGACRLKYYLSSNNIISTSDTDTTWGCDIPALAVGASNTCSGSIDVPNVSAGAYYFGAIADTGGAVTESNENNNSLAASSPTQITVTAATFALNVTRYGSGSGTIASSTGGINCGSTCSASFSSGTVVTLTATPASGSTFSGWGGACSGTGSCQVTMGAAQSVTATFAQAQVVLAPAAEYYHAGFGHYFVTGSADEAAAIDSGVIKGWARTGQTYSIYSQGGAGLSPVCRFFTTSFAPKSSHFYTPSATECSSLKTNRDWQFEANAFYVREPVGGACASGTAPLYRIYNNGHSGAPNHRYTTCTSIRDNMISRGWVSEGVAMCVPGGSADCATDNSGGGVNYNAAPAATPPAMPAITPPAGRVGDAYGVAYTATGSPPISFSATNLPPGLTMSSSGVISGTPTLAGTYTGTVTASNGTAPNAAQSFTIVILANPANCPGGGDSC